MLRREHLVVVVSWLLLIWVGCHCSGWSSEYVFRKDGRGSFCVVVMTMRSLEESVAVVADKFYDKFV
jgi:hypothetical protein